MHDISYKYTNYSNYNSFYNSLISNKHQCLLFLKGKTLLGGEFSKRIKVKGEVRGKTKDKSKKTKVRDEV